MRIMIASYALLTLLATTSHAAPPYDRNLDIRMQRLENDMATMRSNVNSNYAPRGVSTSASATAQIMRMEEEMRSLRGQIEQSQYRIQKLEEQQKQMNEQFTLEIQQLRGSSTESDTGEDALVKPPKDASTTEDTSTPEAQSSAGESRKSTAPQALDSASVPQFSSPREHYNHAFDYINRADFIQAQTVLQSFLVRYPGDALTSNVYYWLGRTYFIQENYASAASSFRHGFESETDGRKAPDNLLDLARSLAMLGETQKACIILRQIPEKYTDKDTEKVISKARSEEARLKCSAP